MKILVSAYACCPGRGSEPNVGWNTARQAAREHDVVVLTMAAWRPAIEAELRRDPPPHPMTFRYVELAPLLRWWNRGEPAGWLHYYLWQFAALRAARELHARTPFDLAHHASFVSWRVPCLLWKLGVPLLWGPVGGGQSVPPGFQQALSRRGRLAELVRNLASNASTRDPFLRATASHARLTLAANESTRAWLHHRLRCPSRLFQGCGLPELPPPRTSPLPESPLRLLWAGRLVSWKGLSILLHALARVAPRVPVVLDVLGDGPELGRLRRWCRRAGLDASVRFLGTLPYAEFIRAYAGAHVFAFPSLRDTYAFVVLEAMAAGLPCIVLDWAGPGELVTDACGVRIPARGFDDAVRGFAEAIERLAGDPELRKRLGGAARERVREHFLWDRRGEALHRVYAELAAGAGRGAVSGENAAGEETPAGGLKTPGKAPQ